MNGTGRVQGFDPLASCIVAYFVAAEDSLKLQIMKQLLFAWAILLSIAITITLWVMRAGPPVKELPLLPFAAPSHAVHLDSVRQHPDGTIYVEYTQDGKEYGLQGINKKQFDSLICIP